MKQFHPENAGNDICETLHLKIFPGEHAPLQPRSPYNPSSYASRRADKRLPPPPKKIS